ncbi:MAG: isocitrate/isopropylmalate dehydrogenase family protein [Candidatus Bathyarchaeia archaeon]
MNKSVAIIPGDGIGPEIVSATMKILNSMNLPLEFVKVECGRKVWEKFGKPLLEEDLEVIRDCDALLKGPIETPAGSGTYQSVNVTLRKELDLYANLRPFKSVPGLALIPDVDMVIIRENTEGMYSGLEYRLTEDVAVSLRVITGRKSERIVKFAFEYALKTGRRKVTAVHKANILKETCGLFIETARKIAQKYPTIKYDELHVDAAAYKIVNSPHDLDVIVTTNLFGDILSDEAAGVTGGLGIAASANVGEKKAMFEAVHGTASNIAGKGIANPTSLLRASVMMLGYFGFKNEAEKLNKAIMEALKNKEARTPDIGGLGNTDTFVNEILKNLGKTGL